MLLGDREVRGHPKGHPREAPGRRGRLVAGSFVPQAVCAEGASARLRSETWSFSDAGMLGVLALTTQGLSLVPAKFLR